MNSSGITIDTCETFPHFPKAPIVEAIIDIRARATTKLDESGLRAFLDERLAGYALLDSQREVQAEMAFGQNQPLSQAVKDLGWKGVRYRSSDQKHVVQFNRDGFVFSRFHPYQNWEQLESESLRLWAFFREFAQPVAFQRIGLRFINRFQLAAGDVSFNQYIHPVPQPPQGLDVPFHAFLHQDTLAVPGHPYAINVTRTIQPSAAGKGEGVALILDIDVFTLQEFELDETGLSRRLHEMRWLKNKVFFGSVGQKAKSMFQ